MTGNGDASTTTGNLLGNEVSRWIAGGLDVIMTCLVECVISATEADIMKSLRNESTHLTVITSPATSLFYAFVIVNKLLKSSTVSSAHHISNLVDRFALYHKVIKRVYNSNMYTTNYVFTTINLKSIITDALCSKPWLIVIRTFGMHYHRCGSISVKWYADNISFVALQ